MPKPILGRLRPNSVEEFRAAALVRYVEAERLANAGYGTGAIYLWGYAAEMTLKAAYFSLVGFGLRQSIGIADLRVAVERTAPAVGLQWPAAGKLHKVEYWARLLAADRRSYGASYADPQFEQSMISRARCVYDRWRETLRYHKNRAYEHEVRQVYAATRWLLDHSLVL
ncbi:MAG TPA: hypothetical protein VNH11_15585 [Pirellulales bacterium]|nr:hypothetical protein [Pirellulales bacterium]